MRSVGLNNRGFNPPQKLSLGSFAPPKSSAASQENKAVVSNVAGKSLGVRPLVSKPFVSPTLVKPSSQPTSSRSRSSFAYPFIYKSELVSQELSLKRPLPPSVDEDEPAEKIPRVSDLDVESTELKEEMMEDSKPEEPSKIASPSTQTKLESTPLKFSTAFKNPLTIRKATVEKEDPDASVKTYWTVLWCRHSTKKHKTYTDGVIVCKHGGPSIELLDMSGKSIGKSTSYAKKVLEGLVVEAELFITGKDVILQAKVDESEFLSGRIFLQNNSLYTSSAASLLSKPVLKSSTMFQKSEIFDPNADDAFVLYRPPSNQSGFSVVLDPRLTRMLRPHQREGVQFMYNCLNSSESGSGCILADEMGLGKTLQTLCVLWTLLKQGPKGLPTVRRVIIVTPSSLVKNWGKEIKKWLGSERVKALMIGDESKGVSTEHLENFSKSTATPVLILSYEQCRQHSKLLSTIPFGLMICDEGHRLRNPNNKTTAALNAIQTRRRILLSGTPFQNNLNEFFALVDFCNGGVLGTFETFRHAFAKPIEKSRDPKCAKDVKKAGEERAKELFNITQKFILRRTAEVLEKFLPPRTDQVLFCAPTELQLRLYKAFLRSDDVESVFRSGNVASALTCIITLKKICNHPQLLLRPSSASSGVLKVEKKKSSADDVDEEESEEEDNQTAAENLRSQLPDEFLNTFRDSAPITSYSGKLEVLSKLLADIKSTSSDRVVVVSFYQQTLDILQNFCIEKKYGYLRLDGSTQAKLRQDMVDQFNAPDSKTFAFLLSTKAGGEGLNLIGANRLVLFDNDWNPAYERQAMARVWRDGQKKEVFIYRLLTTGTIEEKIFQRQLVKQVMSQKVMHAEMAESDFSDADLKDIFCLTENTDCDTFDLIQNGGKKKKGKEVDKNLQGALQGFTYHETTSESFEIKKLRDDVLRRLLEMKTDAPLITFILSKMTHNDPLPKTDYLDGAGDEYHGDEGDDEEGDSMEVDQDASDD